MKKRGFTLLELLGVIVILSLLALVIIPVVNTVMKDSKEELYGKTINNIELAAKNWASDEENKELLPYENGNCIIVKLSELKSGGYVDLDIKDPRDGKLLTDDYIAVITRKGKRYEYEIITNGDISSKNCYVEVADPTAPLISANIFDGYKKNFGLVISYVSDYGLYSGNSYQYYLSSSKSKLENGSFKNYTNGVSQTIGTNLNGEYYLFVKRIKNLENIESTSGGVVIDINNQTYQRFGPYKFDNINPKWSFYEKSNNSENGNSNYDKLVYISATDSINITFRGTDLNYSSSSLSVDKIKVLIDGVDYSSSITKTLSGAKKITNGVEYTLTLSNFPTNGVLTLELPANTLLDQAGNTNAVSIISPGITVRSLCEFEAGYAWTFSLTKSEQQFIVPCSGKYKLEVAGGNGGSSSYIDMSAGTCSYHYMDRESWEYSGYVTGEFTFDVNQKLYVYVGGNGGAGNTISSDAVYTCHTTTGAGGYNGGLKGGTAAAGSGGATHIALVTGEYSTELKNSGDMLISSKGGDSAKTNNYISKEKSKIGAGENYVNTSSQYYIGNDNIIENSKDASHVMFATITYLGN